MLASRQSITPRDLVLAVIALTLGIALAWMDSSPGFDAVGVTIGLLVSLSALVTAIAGRRPWLWALLIGAPIPIVEVPPTGGTAPLVALLFAAIGAGIGLLARRAIQAGARAT